MSGFLLRVRQIVGQPLSWSVASIVILTLRLSSLTPHPRDLNHDGGFLMYNQGLVPNHGKSAPIGNEGRIQDRDHSGAGVQSDLHPRTKFDSEILVIDGGGVSLFTRPSLGLIYGWNPAPSEWLHDSMDLFDGDIADNAGHESSWRSGRLLLAFRGDIWLYDLRRNGQRGCGGVWIRGPGRVTHCRWAHDGRSMVFSRLVAGSSQVWRGEYPSGQTRRLAVLDGCTDPALSEDGRQIACVKDGDLWIGSSTGEALTRLHLRQARWPAWSPDSKELAFQKWDRGQWDIWKYDLATARAFQLTADPDWDMYPAWSFEGNYLEFGSRRGGRWGIWTISADELAVM